MRMLMSLDTSVTPRDGSFFCRCRTTDRIWLSVLPAGRGAGGAPLLASGCLNTPPPAGRGSARAGKIGGAGRRAFGDVAALGGDDLVEEAARLARVARDVGDALLLAGELLQRAPRQGEGGRFAPREA